MLFFISYIPPTEERLNVVNKEKESLNMPFIGHSFWNIYVRMCAPKIT